MTETRTYTKSFAFRRMPMLRQNPQGWAAALYNRGMADLSWMTRPLVEADAARAALAAHMPELLPDFDALLSLKPDDPATAQYLAQYNMKPWWSGCSQTVCRKPDRITLLRNYDMGLTDCGTFLFEPLEGGGWIIGSPELGWGYLEGINDRGLAVSITFGGRFVAGEGFGVPIIVRYLLQTTGSVPEAVAVLKRLPHRLAQNYLLVDREGRSAMLYTSPDQGVVVMEDAICCTNHQHLPPHPEQEAFTHTGERLAFLQARAGAVTMADMFREPLMNRQYEKWLGTLYTAEYDPVALTARYGWPEREITLTPDSPETEFTVTLTGVAG